jgi:FkbM family methyltransferase
MISIYTHPQFINKIDKQSIRTIVECGSRDCLDAIEMNNYYYPDIIYSFECNPESIDVCKTNLLPNIKLIEKAVCDKNGIVDFYPTDMDKSIDKNIGASSLLWHRDNKVEFFQKHIQVGAIRLDTFMEQEGISGIDLLCMDLQGAEHLALEGLGSRIKDVRYIISEVSFKSHYEGDMLRVEIRRLLNKKGFDVLQYISGNVLFKRR